MLKLRWFFIDLGKIQCSLKQLIQTKVQYQAGLLDLISGFFRFCVPRYMNKIEETELMFFNLKFYSIKYVFEKCEFILVCSYKPKNIQNYRFESWHEPA